MLAYLAQLDPGPEPAGPGGLEVLIFLVVLGTTVWVFFDAPTRGLSRWWAGGFLLLWIVAFPWYLVTRSRAGARPAASASPYARPDQGPSGWWDIDPSDPAHERWREADGSWTDTIRPRRDRLPGEAAGG